MRFTAPYYTFQQLRNMEDNEIQFPYSSEDATYDGLKHQYVLTREYFAERGHLLEVEISGTRPDRVQAFLNEVSRKVYTYIYTHSKSPKGVLDYMIAKRGLRGYTMFEYRDTFLEAMYLEGLYLITNGDISSISGVDLDTMQEISAATLRREDRDMHKDTIAILKQLGLNYYGRYRFMPQGNEW